MNTPLTAIVFLMNGTIYTLGTVFTMSNSIGPVNFIPLNRAKFRIALAMVEALVNVGGGQKIPLIKAYRNITGDGLKDAKDAIELAGEVQAQYPDLAEFIITSDTLRLAA